VRALAEERAKRARARRTTEQESCTRFRPPAMGPGPDRLDRRERRKRSTHTHRSFGEEKAAETPRTHDEPQALPTSKTARARGAQASRTMEAAVQEEPEALGEVERRTSVSQIGGSALVNLRRPFCEAARTALCATRLDADVARDSQYTKSRKERTTKGEREGGGGERRRGRKVEEGESERRRGAERRSATLQPGVPTPVLRLLPRAELHSAR